MKRYIKLNSENEIIDLFFEVWKDRFDGTEILLDEVENMDCHINGKCISDEYGNPIFQYIKGKLIHNDMSKYKDKIYDINLSDCVAKRRMAYTHESDGLFFDYQRGEIEKSVWESKVEEIKQRYPKPEKS